ncbi:MAG: hypothetical protein GXP25_04700, partial [Planctomycetes bacterium]|nr:hypothetical protein [Planctomycetota bacterium]
MKTGNRIHRALVAEELELRISPAVFTPGTEAQLRADIITAQTNNEADTIDLSGGTITLTGTRLDNANVSGDLDINITDGFGLTIQNGTVDANDVDRAFHIIGGTSITFDSLTIQGGEVDDDGTTTTDARGGGIYNQAGADITLTNVTLTDN